MEVGASHYTHREDGLAAAGDRRDQHDFIAVLEGVGLAAEEADVFVVDVDVDEAAQLAGLILDLGGERRKGGVDFGDQAREIGSFAGELLLPVGVADEGGRKNDLDADGELLKIAGQGLWIGKQGRK